MTVATLVPPAMPEPNAKFLDGVTPTIEWDGKQWPIPLLAPRENRIVLPAVMRSRITVQKMTQENAPMTTEEYDDLTLIVYWGLRRAHPSLTRDQFDDVPISTIDLLRAMTTVARQTGAVAVGEGGAAAVGEDKAPAPEAPRTGT